MSNAVTVNDMLVRDYVIEFIRKLFDEGAESPEACDSVKECFVKAWEDVGDNFEEIEVHVLPSIKHRVQIEHAKWHLERVAK